MLYRKKSRFETQPESMTRVESQGLLTWVYHIGHLMLPYLVRIQEGVHVGVMGPGVYAIMSRHTLALARYLSDASMASYLGMACGESCLIVLRFTL
jgi:hypothetical protein